MCRSRILICLSEFFTVFTNVLRCTVCRKSLINQRVEGGTYGFYGVFPYTPYIYNIYKKKRQASVLARVMVCVTP